MVWPVLPIIVYDKVSATCWTTFLTALAIPLCGFRKRWSLSAVLLGPVGMGLYLRFLFREAPRGALTTTRASYDARKKEAEKAAKHICATKDGKLRMFKATASNTFRPGQIGDRASKEAKLDLRSFCHVIEGSLAPIDDTYAVVDVEASTTFETMTDAMLELGYMPLVVPELRSITVGGAIVGIGIESSSFKYGFFHESLVEADILLGDEGGRVVTMNATNEYADLFRAVPNSLGSFGYLLRLRVRVRKVKPFVELIKTAITTGPDDLVKAVEDASSSTAKNDFVEAVALSCTGGVLVEGRFVDRPVTSVSNYSWSSGNCFYRNLFDQDGRATTTEYLTTYEYIWRWDSDWFWCTQIFPGLSKWLVRYLCGPSLLRSDKYKVFNDIFTSTYSPMISNTENEELVIQDIEVPVEKSGHWLREHCRVVRSDLCGKIKLNWPKKFGVTSSTTVPIWLCPVTGTGAPLMPMAQGKLYINFGFWDALHDNTNKGETCMTKGGTASGLANRGLESLCPENRAIKVLYSMCYFTEQEFYATYNGTEYHKIKGKYDPDGRLRSWFVRLRGK